jgi:bacterioferritin (cytochrome b1)
METMYRPTSEFVATLERLLQLERDAQAGYARALSRLRCRPYRDQLERCMEVHETHVRELEAALASREVAVTSAALREITERYLADERRHRDWIEGQLFRSRRSRGSTQRAWPPDAP